MIENICKLHLPIDEILIRYHVLMLLKTNALHNDEQKKMKDDMQGF